MQINFISAHQPHAGLPPAQYKAATTDTTVANLDKDGNADSGKDVHMIATIANFVKDSNGNTAGANVFDPTTIGSVIQQTAQESPALPGTGRNGRSFFGAWVGFAYSRILPI